MILRFSCGVVLAGLLNLTATGQTTDEYRLKAAFLYNFKKFVDWPSQAFKSPTDPLLICILGKNPFGDLVYEAVSGKVVQGRTFSVRQMPDVAQAKGCHILFVSGSERKHLAAILEAVEGSGVLTVGETEGFTNDGGVINFRIEGDHIQLHINVGAAVKQQLGISPKLLSLAELVRK